MAQNVYPNQIVYPVPGTINGEKAQLVVSHLVPSEMPTTEVREVEGLLLSAYETHEKNGLLPSGSTREGFDPDDPLKVCDRLRRMTAAERAGSVYVAGRLVTAESTELVSLGKTSPSAVPMPKPLRAVLPGFIARPNTFVNDIVVRRDLQRDSQEEPLHIGVTTLHGLLRIGGRSRYGRVITDIVRPAAQEMIKGEVTANHKGRSELETKLTERGDFVAETDAIESLRIGERQLLQRRLVTAPGMNLRRVILHLEDKYTHLGHGVPLAPKTNTVDI